MARVGLIVNPIAGIGGRMALKGSDDRALVEQALADGAKAVSPERARDALSVVAAARDPVELLTYPRDMGEHEARAAGIDPVVLGRLGPTTTSADTRSAAYELADEGVELLIVAGGDGTAVDVLEAVADRVPIIGIPAGVKMHSAVFAVNPRAAGRLAVDVIEGRVRGTAAAEVMDVDEEALRAGIVSPRLHGYARVPIAPSLVQGAKARSAPSEHAAHARIAREVVERRLGDRLVLIGPGTTTAAIMTELGLEKTVLGVDAVRRRELVARDADERALLDLLTGGDTLIVVTPIGGQGFLFGRGNQQLSSSVLSRVGLENVLVVATDTKLAALSGRPLLVDTGDSEVDASLGGYVRVVTGLNRETVYRVSA
jgi:predicted polyphosphate/ATP-dependent NAD kinase